MKKLTTITLAAITILIMLFSFLPMSTALAKKDDTNVTLKVKNRTGGQVTVMLIDENGNRLFFEYGPGLTKTVVFEGRFRYYASTPCGNQSGVFNLNVSKELFFSCGDGLDVALAVPVGKGAPDQYCYSVWDFPGETPEGGWLDYGPHCQDTPAQVGDTIPNQYIPGEWDIVEFCNSAMHVCIPEHGPAYYRHYICPG